MIRTLVLTAAVMAGLTTTSTSTAEAQGFSIGFGGRGVGVYVGRGGGWGGYYGPSGYYGPGYYSGPRVYSGYRYYGPSYYGGSGYYYSSPYYAPGTVYSDGTVITPSIPAPIFDDGEIVLLNPATNSDSVEYMLNGEHFVMRPGQSQRFTRDRDWIIEFDRGDGNNFARYSLKSSTYKFKTAANGWELFEQADPRPDARTLPPPPIAPREAKPASPPQPVDEPRAKDSVPPPVPDADAPRPRDLVESSENPETVIRPRPTKKPE